MNELASRPLLPEDHPSEDHLGEDHLGKRARVYGSEKAILVAIQTPGSKVDESLRELTALASTAGIPTLLEVVQNRTRPDPSFFIGKGKMTEVKAAAHELGADVVIFDHKLSPAQARNLEEKMKTKVIDRAQLIMDIFAQRATTKEAKLQVELAQLRYLLPRMRGWGNALSRLGGGIGTRGPGETKLELDRNKINRRIHTLEDRLVKACGERELRSKKRRAGPLPLIALVGYTNSGKSTLLNRLCSADVLVEDKLFATLTTTVRRGKIGTSQWALFVDTVGFIRKLPHQLIPAFASTLEMVRNADLILHIVDLSRPSCSEDYEAVIDTLDHEVFTGSDQQRPPLIDVLNKIDLTSQEDMDTEAFHKPVLISASSGENMDVLLARIQETLSQGKSDVSLLLPYSMTQELHNLSQRERVTICGYTKEGIEIAATLSKEDLMRLVSKGGRISPSVAVTQEGP